MKNNKVLLALIFIIGNTFSVFAQEQLAPLIFGQSEQAKKTIKSNEKSHEKTHEKTQEKLSNAQRDLKNLKRQHKNLQKKT